MYTGHMRALGASGASNGARSAGVATWQRAGSGTTTGEGSSEAASLGGSVLRRMPGVA